MVPEDILVEEREEPEVQYDALPELFAGLEYGRRSQFQKRVSEVKRINRVTSGDKSPNMSGRILGSSTDKYLNFVAETGRPVALIT